MMFSTMKVPKLVGDHLGAIDFKTLEVAVAVAINPKVDIMVGNKIGFVNTKGFVYKAAFKLG